MVHALVSSKRLRMAFKVDEKPLVVLSATDAFELAVELATLIFDNDVVG